MLTVYYRISPRTGYIIIQNPNPPYLDRTYIGYTLTEAKRQARIDFGPCHRRIEWVRL